MQAITAQDEEEIMARYTTVQSRAGACQAQAQREPNHYSHAHNGVSQCRHKFPVGILACRLLLYRPGYTDTAIRQLQCSLAKQMTNLII